MTLYRILFLLLVVFVTRLQAADSYEFQLNGKPVKARFISLAGTPESAAPGDVVSLRDFAFVLDAPGRYVLHAPEKDSRRLFRVGEDGKETLLACRVGVEFPANDPKGEKRIWVNPLDGLSPAALAQLRGVRIEDWRPNLPAQLSKLDLARCLLGIHLFGGKEEGFAVGSIPPATRYLWIEQASNVGPTDLGELGKLNELRALCYESPLSDYDLQVLGPLHELRYLEISVRNNSVLHSESLSSLHELRALDLGSAKGLRDAEFLRSLGKLRWLDLQRTSIEDLRALGDLPQLAVVNAELSLVAHLPGQAMSSLREFHLMGAPVDEKDVAAFQKLNPQCSISHDWEAPLQKALAGADRVRVVSPPGGPMFASTGKPEKRETKVFATETKADAIADLIGAFVVDEPTQPFECMCSGSPWLEFYRGETMLATISVQHGFAIRWSAGWPADRQIIPRGQDALTDWLARHGVRGPKEELAGKRERERAENRRMQVMQAILPQEVLEALQKADSEESAAAAFTKNLPDMARRAEVCLRLFGNDFGSWSHTDPLDGLLKERILPEVPSATMSDLELQPHLQAANGLGRWLFFDRKWHDWKPEELEKVLAVVAGDGLTHPRDVNRRKTIIALGEIGTPTAQKLLRAVLRGQLPVRPLPDDAEAEAGGMVTYTPEAKGLPENCSDVVLAAIWLARLADTETKPEMSKLVTTLKGDEHRALERALAGHKD